MDIKPYNSPFDELETELKGIKTNPSVRERSEEVLKSVFGVYEHFFEKFDEAVETYAKNDPKEFVTQVMVARFLLMMEQKEVGEKVQAYVEELKNAGEFPG